MGYFDDFEEPVKEVGEVFEEVVEENLPVFAMLITEATEFLEEFESDFSELSFEWGNKDFDFYVERKAGVEPLLIEGELIRAESVNFEQWQAIHDYFFESGFEEDYMNIFDDIDRFGTVYRRGEMLCRVEGKMESMEDSDLDVDINCGFLDVKISETQEQFIGARGNPGIFTIFFSDAVLNKEGVPVVRDSPLRAEMWVFGTPDNVTTNFENGFFTGEEDLGYEVEFAEQPFSPLDFNYYSSMESVMDLLGDANCTEEVEAGDDLITTLKYEEEANRPLATVSFSNDQIIAVSVGLAFTDNEDGKLCD